MEYLGSNNLCKKQFACVRENTMAESQPKVNSFKLQSFSESRTFGRRVGMSH